MGTYEPMDIPPKHVTHEGASRDAINSGNNRDPLTSVRLYPNRASSEGASKDDSAKKRYMRVRTTKPTEGWRGATRVCAGAKATNNTL